jgi:hypothetical protein
MAFLFPGEETELVFDVIAAGTFPEERELAAQGMRLVSVYVGMIPQCVRVVHAMGTWVEVPTWTGNWFAADQLLGQLSRSVS